MYLDYWGLNKHPFNNVPDPEMYFDMHQSVDSAVAELLFAIEEGDEVLAVVVGPVGSGKTMSLRIVLDSLKPDKHRIAFVTNPDMTFPQLLREIIGQLEGKECQEVRKDKLFEMFNRILFETNDQGKRVVIFIDEGNVIKSYNLESMRLLTNMQEDQQNLFTIILAGQPELGKRLEDPRRANLYQRIGVYCKITGLDSMETLRDYVEHRLERAGLNPDTQIFTPEAYETLWKYSDKGIPRLINKLCKLTLKAAETNKLRKIDANLVSLVAQRFDRTYRKLPKAKPEDEVFASGEILYPSKESKEEMPPEEKPEIETPEQKPPAKELEHHAVASIDDLHSRSSTDLNAMSQKDLEDMASRLATQRVKTLKGITDPFEAWEAARKDILSQIIKKRDSQKGVSNNSADKK